MYQLEYLYFHLRPFFKGGKHGNQKPISTKGNSDPKAGNDKSLFPALTWEEKLKEEALANMFKDNKFNFNDIKSGPIQKTNQLLTTPKNLAAVMAKQASLLG